MASPADVSRTVALNAAPTCARFSATIVQRPGSESPASQTLAWMSHAVASPSAETEPLAVTKSGAILERPAEAVAEDHAIVSPGAVVNEPVTGTVVEAGSSLPTARNA